MKSDDEVLISVLTFIFECSGVSAGVFLCLWTRNKELLRKKCEIN